MVDIVERPHAPPKSSDGRPTYLQVINLFEFYGLRAPPTKLRDEIVMALEWAWYGVEAANEIAALRNRCDKLETALETIRCGYGPNHMSRYARDVAIDVLADDRSLLPKKDG